MTKTDGRVEKGESKMATAELVPSTAKDVVVDWSARIKDACAEDVLFEPPEWVWVGPRKNEAVADPALE